MPDSVKRPISDLEVEVLTNFIVSPTGEQLSMMEWLSVGEWQSTSSQFFDGEQVTDPCKLVLIFMLLVLIWSLMFFMALQRAGDGAVVGPAVGELQEVVGMKVWLTTGRSKGK